MNASQRRYLNDNKQTMMVGARARQQGVLARNTPEEYEKNYYEDVGLSMTADQYAALQEELGSKKTERETALSNLRTAERDMNAAINANKKSMDQLWSDYSKDFVAVRSIGPNDKIEDVHYLPREVVDQLNTKVFNQGDYTYTGNWQDGGANYNVSAKLRTADEWYGKELREILEGTDKEVRSAFETNNAAEIEMLNKTLEQQRSGYQKQINDSRKAIRLAEQSEKDTLEGASGRRSEKLEGAYQTAMNIGVR